MPSLRAIVVFACLGIAAATCGAMASPTPPGRVAATPSVAPPAPPYLPGREEDARVARIAFRLAIAGQARCPALQPHTGLVLQHLSQFQLADRPGVVAALPLDRGPGVIAVVPGSPADMAGVRAGDIVLAIDGIALPAEPGLSEPFQLALAHDRADAIDDLLAVTHPQTLTLSLSRDGVTRSARLAAVAGCPSYVRLARSGQRDAFADGRHAYLSTGILSLLRNDDELAFIIAHEMSHNILGHAAIMRGGSVRKGLGRTLGSSGEIVRGTERQADALGAELMLDAGLDPISGTAILARLGGSDFGIALLATHDSPSQRIAAVRAVVQARTGR